MRILISAGPTREPIDAVRYLSNRSSGRLGVELANEGLRRGHQVCVVHGPLQVERPEMGTWVEVERADEMLEALRRQHASCDVLIMAAAVCDVAPLRAQAGKLEKDALQQLDLKKNVDIAAALGREKQHQHHVVFSLGEKLDRDTAMNKLKSKGADWIVLNTLESMSAESGAYGIMGKSGKYLLEPEQISKQAFALKLFDLLEKVRVALA